MEIMKDEEIRKRVQERLASGRLPRQITMAAGPVKAGVTPPNAVVVGSSLNDPCAVCDARGTQERYNSPIGPVAFHTLCYAIWKEEAAKPVRRT